MDESGIGKFEPQTPGNNGHTVTAELTTAPNRPTTEVIPAPTGPNNKEIAPSPDPKDQEIAELKKQLAELQRKREVQERNIEQLVADAGRSMHSYFDRSPTGLVYFHRTGKNSSENIADLLKNIHGDYFRLKAQAWGMIPQGDYQRLTNEFRDELQAKGRFLGLISFEKAEPAHKSFYEGLKGEYIVASGISELRTLLMDAILNGIYNSSERAYILTANEKDIQNRRQISNGLVGYEKSNGLIADKRNLIANIFTGYVEAFKGLPTVRSINDPESEELFDEAPVHSLAMSKQELIQEPRLITPLATAISSEIERGPDGREAKWARIIRTVNTLPPEIVASISQHPLLKDTFNQFTQEVMSIDLTKYENKNKLQNVIDLLTEPIATVLGISKEIPVTEADSVPQPVTPQPEPEEFEWNQLGQLRKD